MTSKTLSARVQQAVRAVPDFPKQGILFRDITPLLQSPQLMADVTDWFAAFAKSQSATKVVAIESRGFLFGASVCERLRLPLALARKAGKLPHHTISKSYALEYGEATLQMHRDSVVVGDRVVIIDDVLATGGTAAAVTSLIKDLGGETVGSQFLIEIAPLKGRHLLGGQIESLIVYE